MAEIVKHILISAIDLAVKVMEAANEVTIFKEECDEVKIKVQKLLELLEKTVTASSKLCEFPTRYVISKAETVLHKSLWLINKCIPKLINRVITIIPAFSFRKLLILLDETIGDVLWLLNVSTPSSDGDKELFGLPPSAINEPVLFLIFELMAILFAGTTNDSCEAAKSLRSLEDREVRSNTVMLLIEITAVAEQDSDLRRSAFNSRSPVFKAIVNQIHKLFEENRDTVLVIPYITLIGNLARAFRASDTHTIEQLVKHIGHQDPEVSREAVIALTKFASPCNYLHKDHSRAIVEAGGARKLVELSYLGCDIRIPALELLLCITLHVPENEEVIKVLEWASRS